MITVIMPTWNRLELLREAVASVLVQSFTDWELVVVDDYSQDGTWQWLESLDNRRIRPVRMERHLERSASRNAGLRAARGEYVIFMDDDDFLLDSALARLHQSLREHESAIAAIGARSEFGQSGCRRVPHPRRGYLRDTWQDVMFGWTPGCGQALIRRSAIARAGGWNERLSLAEDHDLWLRLARLGPMVLIPETVVACRIHTGQTSRVGAALRTIVLRRAYLAGVASENRARAERTLRALRLSRVALRSFRRGRYRDACRRSWQTLRQAPWLLASPISRPEIAGLVLRSMTGILFGENAVRRLRHLKRAWTKTLRKGTGSRLPAEAGLEIGRREAS